MRYWRLKVGIMQPQAKAYGQSPETGRDKAQIFSRSPQKTTALDFLHLDFSPVSPF